MFFLSFEFSSQSMLLAKAIELTEPILRDHASRPRTTDTASHLRSGICAGFLQRWQLAFNCFQKQRHEPVVKWSPDQHGFAEGHERLRCSLFRQLRSHLPGCGQKHPRSGSLRLLCQHGIKPQPIHEWSNRVEEFVRGVGSQEVSSGFTTSCPPFHDCGLQSLSLPGLIVPKAMSLAQTPLAFRS